MYFYCVYCKGSGIDEDDGGECEVCEGDGKARCERRACKNLGVVFNDNGEALCEDHLIEADSGEGDVECASD